MGGGARPVTLFSARLGNLRVQFLNLNLMRIDREEIRSIKGMLRNIRPCKVRGHNEVPPSRAWSQWKEGASSVAELPLFMCPSEEAQLARALNCGAQA